MQSMSNKVSHTAKTTFVSVLVTQHALGFTSYNYCYRGSYACMQNTTLILPTVKTRVSLVLI